MADYRVLDGVECKRVAFDHVHIGDVLYARLTRNGFPTDAPLERIGTVAEIERCNDGHHVRRIKLDARNLTRSGWFSKKLYRVCR